MVDRERVMCWLLNLYKGVFAKVLCRTALETLYCTGCIAADAKYMYTNGLFCSSLAILLYVCWWITARFAKKMKNRYCGAKCRVENPILFRRLCVPNTGAHSSFSAIVGFRRDTIWDYGLEINTWDNELRVNLYTRSGDESQLVTWPRVLGCT